MATPQDWAPYYSIEDAAKVYLRDPIVALDQLRGVVDFPSIQSFFMSRRSTEESWGEALWRLSEVRLRMYTQLITRSHEKSATDTDYFCESFRYDKSVESGGLAQMERLLQFGRVLSRCM
jgi:hypothetical protein